MSCCHNHQSSNEAMMKRNPGRPTVTPTKPYTTLTIRVPALLKQQMINQAEAVDLTLTAYITALVIRDGS